MIKHNQDGAVNGVVISLVMSVVFLIGALSFAAWAFTGRQDYKNNTDQKIATAVEVAKQQTSTEKDKQFAEAEKQPYKTYSSPSSLGSIVMQYPKTWSGVVEEANQDGGSGEALNGYFYPGVVPSLSSEDSTFALRMQIVGQSYSSVLEQLAGLQQDEESPSSIVPYALPKFKDIVGVRVTGKLPNDKTGTMIVLPLRSQTLQIWTEGSQFRNDFENSILPNFTFSP